MLYNKEEEPGTVMDRNQLLKLLAEYYETTDLEEMKPKLKNDLKGRLRIQGRYSRWRRRQTDSRGRLGWQPNRTVTRRSGACAILLLGTIFRNG